MKVFGIGVDIVEIGRMELAIDRSGEAFLQRVFTDDERAYCGSKARPATHYAARFAAKEAVAKALGTGIGARAGLVEIEVVRDARGVPGVRLAGRALEHARACGVGEIKVSLSHGRDYAVANALAIAHES
jgi:holo-[acyl-carrier protein] synthase